MKTPGKKNKSQVQQGSTAQILNWVGNNLDQIVLVFVFLYFSIDMLQRGYDRFEIVRLQFFYLNLINVLSAGFILFRSSDFQVPIRQLFRKNYIPIAYCLFVIFCGISFIAAPNISLSIVHFAQILVVGCMMINLSILLYNRLHLIYVIGLIAGFTGFFQAFTVLIHFKSFTDPVLISQFLDSSILEGNSGNMNIMSSGLLIKLPLVLLALTHYTGFRRVFLALALFAMFFCIFLINARTALITIPFIIGGYLVFFYTVRKHLSHHLIKLAYIFIPFLFSFFLSNFVLGNSGKAGRHESTAARISEINIDQSSTQARLWFWENGIDMVKDHPVFGVGIGNWMVEQIPYGKSRYVLSMNAHNDFIEIMAETGLLNGLLYLSIFIALLLINIKRAWKFTDKRQQIVAFLALLLLFVYGIDALINFPLHRPTMQIGFALLVVLSIINREYSPEPSSKKYVYVLLLFFAILPIYVTWHAQRTSLLDRIVILDKIDSNASGMLTGDQLAAWKPKLPNVSRQTTVSYDEYTGIYYPREKRYDDAIRYLDKGNAIHSKLGRADYYKYIMAEERNMSDSAYHYLKNTFRNAPFYEGWYNQLVKYAGAKKDTATIFSSYALYKVSARQPLPDALINTAYALRTAGYPHEKTLAFVRDEQKRFSADSMLNTTVNNFQITQLLVEGQDYFDRGMYKESLDMYKQAMEIDSTSVYALQNMGLYYYNRGEYKSGIPYLLRSLDKPGLTGGLSEYVLGVSYIQLQDKKEGCRFLQQAIKKKHSKAANYFNQVCQ